MKVLYGYEKQNKLLRLNSLGPTINTPKVFINRLNNQLKFELPNETPNKFFSPGWVNEINEMREEKLLTWSN